MEAYMNTNDKCETTYFYWDSFIRKPTGKLKSKKCDYYEQIGEQVLIVPFHENDFIKSYNCPLFAVRTNETEKKVYLSYFFRLPYQKELPLNSYETILDETEPLFWRTMFFSVADGTFGIVEPEDTLPMPAEFDIVPDKVLKFCFKEIRRLQGIKDFFPLSIKGKEPGNTLYLPFCDIHFHNKKTHFSIKYLEAIIAYPYIPFLYFLEEYYEDFLFENKSYEPYIPWYVNFYFEKLANINGMDPKSYKEFFKAINKIPSKFYLRRIFENPKKFADRLFLKYAHSIGLEKIITIDKKCFA